ncbi:hypothetical protein V6N11_046898 [Hibiscus sabdariffa]|uniref:At1g61320/AtMIF1 LRR domain-containing protein n=1 Tax=Hibiscus sabdariffa TaxID=183260 RepID=A0ABR2ND05_9ROSI
MSLVTEEIKASASEVYHGDEICQEKSKSLLQEMGMPRGLLPLKDIEECGITPYVSDDALLLLQPIGNNMLIRFSWSSLNIRLCQREYIILTAAARIILGFCGNQITFSLQSSRRPLPVHCPQHNLSDVPIQILPFLIFFYPKHVAVQQRLVLNYTSILDLAMFHVYLPEKCWPRSTIMEYDENLMDRISELPQELLARILCLLPFEEVVRTTGPVLFHGDGEIYGSLSPGQVLESLLSGCPLLETLHVSHSQSAQLTKLELRDVSYGLPRIKERDDVLQAFPSCLETCASQLVNLSLQFPFEVEILHYPKLPNLRYLTCEVREFDFERESKGLLKFWRWMMNVVKEVQRMIKKRRRLEMKSLRVVEIVGFVGAEADTTLLLYLAKTALNLDNIVINTCPPHWDKTRLEGLPMVCSWNIDLKELTFMYSDSLLLYRIITTFLATNPFNYQKKRYPLQPKLDLFGVGSRFKHEYNDNLKDWISQLPEELLARIFSSLSFEEVGGVCRMDYSSSKLTSSYELRVDCDLTVRYTPDINRWIEVALMKKVKRLELDFKPCSSVHLIRDSGCYRFERRFCASSEIKLLTSLCFKHVNVCGQVLESVLSNCPLLEKLHVSHSPSVQLTKLDVSGSSLRLKHLHISFCKHLKLIEVYAPNLVSFEHSSRKAEHLVLRYIPQLRDVSYGVPWMCFIGVDGLRSFPGCLSTCASQLVNLSLQFLFEIELEMDYTHRLKKGGGEEIEKAIQVAEMMIRYRGGHKTRSLREVEIVGFSGAEAETALLIYLAKTSLNLDSIAINTRPSHWNRAAKAGFYLNKPGKARRFDYDLLLKHLPEGADIHLL